MKITKRQLKRIIREEYSRINEGSRWRMFDWQGSGALDRVIAIHEEMEDLLQMAREGAEGPGRSGSKPDYDLLYEKMTTFSYFLKKEIKNKSSLRSRS